MEWVEAWNCNWLHEAHFVKSVLEGNGMDARIPDEYLAGVQPLLAGAIGGIRVLVLSTDLARAREILNKMLPESIDTGTADDDRET